MYKQVIAILFLFVASVGAITLLEPVQQTVGETPISLGVIGPGQTIAVKFARDTGLPAPINPTTGKNALWDQASIVTPTLPAGWGSKDSLKYENPLTVYVTSSPAAEKGEYNFSIAFTDEYEGTPTQVADFKVTVDPDVLDVGLVEPTVSAGIGQPAIFQLVAKNKGAASDTFTIKASGLPYDWQFTKTFFLPRGKEASVYFEVVGNIQKEVPFQINITSISSSKITKTANARVVTTSDLFQDAKSASLGLPLFPSAEQQIYALFGLVANLASQTKLS